MDDTNLREKLPPPVPNGQTLTIQSPRLLPIELTRKVGSAVSLSTGEERTDLQNPRRESALRGACASTLHDLRA